MLETIESPIPTCSLYNCPIPDWLLKCLEANQNPQIDQNNDLICRTFKFAYQLHEGQCRKSGEPYICHPIAVAGLLKDLGGSSSMIAAGFLHDIIEDTDVTPEELEKHFGSEIRFLVEGVTKLSKYNFKNKTERQAENFRRMFLAMAQDIRVLVVKLADRLHNMRTLEHLEDQKRIRIAEETLEIFAPLANRLGIGTFKWELEDLSFKYLNLEAYRKIEALVNQKRSDRETQLANVEAILKQNLSEAGIVFYDISSRPKHLYSIYQKMERQNKQFNQIYDLSAIRIIVETIQECYLVLGHVHNLFKPIPGRLKDYIGLPKNNQYQSLHTVVIYRGAPLEIQIRTLEMHHIAEYGIAAHWKYKESGHSSINKLTATDEKFIWLRQVLEWQKDLKDAQEYLDTVRNDLFEDEVYVFTPNGDVIPLARGSTPVDFAYRIHTEVGNHCARAKVNNQIVPLNSPLKNGDLVEILTQKNTHPSLDWLNFVVTTTAKNRIRQWYKRTNREENILRGREMLEKSMGKTGFEALLKSEPMKQVVEKLNYHSVDDLLSALGYGELTLNLLVNRIREATIKAQKITPKPDEIDSLLSPPSSQNNTKNCPIAGLEGLLHQRAGCCSPLPGEPIIGVITKTRGITIHHRSCQNIENIDGDRLLPINWTTMNNSNHRPNTYLVNLQIEAIDRVGLLNDILSRLRDDLVNVTSVNVKTAINSPAHIYLSVEMKDHEQLERCQNQIKNMSDVLSIRRTGHQTDNY